MKSPAWCLSMWLSVSTGKQSKTHTELHHNFPGKAKFYNVFFPQNIYVCITVSTELQSISCWPTECIILLPISHFKITALATSMKFANFSLLLRNSKIASSKTLIHLRMDTSGIEQYQNPFFAFEANQNVLTVPISFKHSKQRGCIQIA